MSLPPHQQNKRRNKVTKSNDNGAKGGYDWRVTEVTPNLFWERDIFLTFLPNPVTASTSHCHEEKGKRGRDPPSFLFLRDLHVVRYWPPCGLSQCPNYVLEMKINLKLLLC